MELAENKQVVQSEEIGFVSKVVNVFFEPTKTFNSLFYKFNIIGIIILIIVSYTLLAIPKAPLVEEYAVQMTEKMFKSETYAKTMPNMSKEQKENAINMGGKTQKLVSYAVGVIVVLSLLIQSLIFYGISKIFKGTGTFRNTFAVMLYSGLIGILGELVRTANVLITGKIDVTNSFGLLMESDKTSIVYNMINSMDIFSIWSLIVTGIGLAAVHKISRNKAYTTVFSVWLIYIVGVSASTAMSAAKMLNEYGITI